jgi:4-oxalocrotonate tautomerase
MPYVTIDMWEGRTQADKAKLARDITKAFVNVGVPAAAVNIVMNDHPKSCWAQAGKLCDGFELPPEK